jgi:hypothetical protein
MKHTLSINTEVTVKLTERGKKIYREYMGELPPGASYEFPEKMEIWQLMHIFGKHMTLLSDPVFFNDDMVISESDWKETRR